MKNQNSKDLKSNTTVSIFKNLNNSSTPIDEKTMDFIYETIRNNPKSDEILAARASGKKNADKSHVIKVWNKALGIKEEKHVNYYDYVKSEIVQMYTPNATFTNGRRNTKYVKETPNCINGQIYGDTDTFEEIISNPKYSPTNEDEAKEYVWATLTDAGLGFIESAWKSFGGEGFGFIVNIEGLTIENFNSTWKHLHDTLLNCFGIKLDGATKDITRPNVISHDPQIFIRPVDERIKYTAVEPVIASDVQQTSFEGEISNDFLKAHKISYTHALRNIGKYEIGNRNAFSMSYAGCMNQFGVPYEVLCEMPHNFTQDSIVRCQKAYDLYENQFNTVKIEETEEQEELPVSKMETVAVNKTSESYIKAAKKFLKSIIFEKYASLPADAEFDEKLMFSICVLGNKKGLEKDLVLACMQECTESCEKLFACHDESFFVLKLNKVYSQYSKQFGENLFELLEKPKDLKVDYTINLKSGEFLSLKSDEVLKLVNKHRISILKSGTGSGKSHWACDKKTFSRTLFLVQTNPLLNSIVNDENNSFTPYNEDSKIISDFTVATYASAKNLSKEVNIDERFDVVFFDETQNFGLGGFMLDSLEDVLHVLGNVKRIPIIGLSATPIKMYGLFGGAKLININQEVKNKPKYLPIFYDEDKTSHDSLIMSSVVEMKSKGLLSIVYLNNTKKRLIKYKTTLTGRGVKVGLINSKVKDSKEFDEICHGYVAKGIDCIICTSIMEAGLSITKSNKKVVYFFGENNVHPIVVKQMAARVRGYESAEVRDYFPITKIETEQVEKGNVFIPKDFTSMAKRALKLAIELDNLRIENSEPVISNELLEQTYMGLVKRVDGELTISHAALMVRSLKEETDFYNRNFEERVNALEKLGFEIIKEEVETPSIEISDEEKLISKEVIKQSFNFVEKSIDLVCEELSGSTFGRLDCIVAQPSVEEYFEKSSVNQNCKDFFADVINENVELPVFFKEALKTFIVRLIYLKKYCKTVDEAIVLLKDKIGLSDSSFDKFIEAMTIRRMKNNSSECLITDNTYISFLNTINKAFEIDKSYNLAEMKELYLTCANQLTKNQRQYRKIYVKMSEKSVMKQLKLHFTIQKNEREINKDTGKKVTTYTIKDVTPYGLDPKPYVTNVKNPKEKKKGFLVSEITTKDKYLKH